MTTHDVEEQLGGYVPPAIGHPEADQAEFMRGYEMGIGEAARLREAVRVLRKAIASPACGIAYGRKLKEALESTKEFA